MGIKNAFKKMIVSLVRWATIDECEKEKYGWRNPPANPSASIGNSINSGNNNGMNFTVYRAIGGTIIQLRTYDQRTDNDKSSLYIITDKENLGDELGKIITVECLSR